MKYYRVIPKGADKYIFNHFTNGKQVCIYLIKNELYTEKEKEKYDIPVYYLEEVNISMRNIYWSFGVRFENKKYSNKTAS